jgi:hypothetical protein
MMMHKGMAAWIAAIALLSACDSDDVPPAHKGMMFDRTGSLAFYSGGNGLTGPVLGPGTYFTGAYDEIRAVDCSEVTLKEALGSLTKDNVQFKMDVYVRYAADCTSDAKVRAILDRLSGTGDQPVVKPQQLYDTYVRGQLGEAVRKTVSVYGANDINPKRDAVTQSIRDLLRQLLAEEQPLLVRILEVNISNFDFPDQLEQANIALAEQAILKDKAIAERERVTAEQETARMSVELEATKGRGRAAYIDEVGAAIRRNPQFIDYELLKQMPDIYRAAGEKGNLVITAPNPTVMLDRK